MDWGYAFWQFSQYIKYIISIPGGLRLISILRCSMNSVKLDSQVSHSAITGLLNKERTWMYGDDTSPCCWMAKPVGTLSEEILDHTSMFEIPHRLTKLSSPVPCWAILELKTKGKSVTQILSLSYWVFLHWCWFFNTLC